MTAHFEFAPGEKFRYSSSAYIVLGYLIEKLSGGTYEQFLKNNIFVPLGMKNSGYHLELGDHSSPRLGLRRILPRGVQRHEWNADQGNATTRTSFT